MSIVLDHITLGIFEVSGYDDDKVYQSPYSASAQSEQLRDTNACVAGVKTVSTEDS